MIDLILKWLNAGQTPLLALVAAILWKIKTNDLPHILERIASLEGRNMRVDRRPRKRRR